MRTLYEIRNRATGATYVGQTGNLFRRITSHFSELRNFNHPNRAMQEDWYEWPEPFWEWRSLGEYEDDKIDMAEVGEIARRVSDGFSYNKIIAPLGGKKMSESSSQKKRQARIGIKRDPETVMKVLRTKSLRPRTAREIAATIRNGRANKGRKLTEEHKKKISPLGRKHSEETKRKMSEKRIAYWKHRNNE